MSTFINIIGALTDIRSSFQETWFKPGLEKNLVKNFVGF